MTIKLLTEHHLEFLRLKGGFTYQNVIFLEITFTDYVSGKLGQGGQTLK